MRGRRCVWEDRDVKEKGQRQGNYAEEDKAPPVKSIKAGAAKGG